MRAEAPEKGSNAETFLLFVCFIPGSWSLESRMAKRRSEADLVEPCACQRLRDLGQGDLTSLTVFLYLQNGMI